MQELRLFKVGKISIHLPCGSHVGAQNNAHQPIFPFYVIGNSPTSLAYNSAVFVPNTLTMVQRHVIWFYSIYRNLEQFNHNLHNHVLITSYPNHQYRKMHLRKFDFLFVGHAESKYPSRPYFLCCWVDKKWSYDLNSVSL